jgi:hypothetical protein
MTIYRHPHEAAEFEALDDGLIRVKDLESGKEGVFAVGGVWQSGTLKYCDIQFMRYVYDLQKPIEAINAALRS